MKNSGSGKMSFNVAIVGGGRACRFFLEHMGDESFNDFDFQVLGVCDTNPDAEGFCLAKEMGIYTTTDYRDLFKIKQLNALVELTGSREVLLELTRLKPEGLGLLEHNFGRLLKNYLVAAHSLQGAQEEATSQREASDFLMQQANERISVLNPDFVILDANEAYLKAWKKNGDKVIGAHCYEITHGLSVPCSSSNPGLGCPMLDTLRTGQSAHIIHEHVLFGDSPTYCDLVTYPIKDKKGKIIKVIEISRDLTDELSSRWENRVKAIKDDLKKFIQEDRMISLGKLVASSVHEINNPIQGLLTFTGVMQEILKEGTLDEEGREDFKRHLALMSRELERCGKIVSGLLSFSRESSIHYEDVDLNEILRQVITLTRHKMEIQQITLDTQLVSLPLMLNGDLHQLQQCFLNIIFNAMDAMPDGGRLTISSEPEQDGEHAVIRIQDTGYGIPAEHLEHIFDPFFTTKAEGEGTGLGLSITYGIVKNHGGEIKVDSRPGQGTTFVLKFSLVDALDG